MYEVTHGQLQHWRRRIQQEHPFLPCKHPRTYAYDDSTNTEHLGPYEPRYVDLDLLRGGGIAEALASIRRYSASGLPAASGMPGVVRLLAGGRGTGRTTELRRLARALEHDEDLVVLPVDLGRHGLFARAPTPEALRAKLSLEIREAARLELGRWQLPASSDPYDVVAELVEQLAPRRLLLLVDQFDALAVPPWEVARAHRGFAKLLQRHSHTFALPGCLTVYVVSDALVLANPGVARLYEHPPWFLPALRLWKERSCRGLEEEAARRLEQVLARWVDLDALFRSYRPQHVRQLVELSGGNLGVLAQLLLTVLDDMAQGWAILGPTTIEDAAARVRPRLFRWGDRSELLDSAFEAGQVQLLTGVETNLFIEAMHSGAIQSYWGGWRGETLWQDVHTLVHAR